MTTNKTLFDAVDAELRNARAALSQAGGYLDLLRTARESDTETKDEEIIIPLSLNDIMLGALYGVEKKVKK